MQDDNTSSSGGVEVAKVDRTEELRAILQQREDWHVFILESGLSHARVSLALHPLTFPHYIRVDCLECSRIEGDIQGGPFQLTVRPIELPDRDKRLTMWELRSTDGRFRLVYGWVAEIRQVNMTPDGRFASR